MIYVFGDLRQLRSFELVRPPISSPQRLRPLRNITTSVRRLPSPELEPEPLLVPITRPPILPKPVYDPVRFLTPIPEPVSPSFVSNTGLQTDATNPRDTMSSLLSGSFTSCDSDTASRTPTPSSDEVEIQISEMFYDIEPSYLRDDLMSSSPVPSSWQGESPANTLTPWTSSRVNSALTTSSSSRRFLSSADNDFRSSNARTFNTSDSEQEKWIPTAPFIKPFEYHEWEEWDGESVMYTNDGSLGGYSAGDEESRISHFFHPTSLRQDAPGVIGTRRPSQLLSASRRGTINSSKLSQELGTFDFDALPAVAPVLQRRPRYRTCEASPAPPAPHDETNLIEAGRQQGILKTWLIDLPKSFIRKTQGKCGAAKQVIKDILGRSTGEGGQDGGQYRDAPASETEDVPIAGEMSHGRGLNSPTTNSVPQRPFSLSHCRAPNTKEKRKVEENWRVRWKRALTVPAFRSPLTKILSPVVTRAQWEVAVRSATLAFVISSLVVAVLVAVPIP